MIAARLGFDLVSHRLELFGRKPTARDGGQPGNQAGGRAAGAGPGPGAGLQRPSGATRR